MPSNAREDIRKLLKEFGLSADEAVISYLIEEKPSQPLHLRLTLEDLTEYSSPPEQKLHIEVEGHVGP